MLACGAEPKSTFCVVEVDRAWIGHHIGDLGDVETTQSFREGIEHLRAPLRAGVDLVGVQHHHAHMAASWPNTVRPGRRSARSTTARDRGPTAACGLFDAVAVLCGLRTHVTGYPLPVADALVLDARPAIEALGDAGLRVLVPERVPANDGGIAYGQAAVGAARLSGDR